MIKYLSRHKLNIEKYNACIQMALSSRIYAYSWYLDIVTDDWDVLVLNNYEAVMPLPKRKKLGVNYIYLPPWVQQLGVFSVKDINNEIVKEFLQAIPRKFVLIDLFLNTSNSLDHKNITLRKNYILDLNTSYNDLFNNFSKGRKSSVNLAKKSNLKVEENLDYKALIELFETNKGLILKKSNYEYKIIENLISALIPLQKIKIYHIKNIDDQIIGGAVFLYDNNRITYLFSALNNEGRKQQAMSFLIDHILHIYANSNFIFDFEGSMVPKVASFIKSFGSVLEPYYHFKQKRLKLI
ncbi:MAG: GNAT family N-acetyltransferase [Bacteroidota bacterium]